MSENEALSPNPSPFKKLSVLVQRKKKYCLFSSSSAMRLSFFISSGRNIRAAILSIFAFRFVYSMSIPIGVCEEKASTAYLPECDRLK